MEPIVPATVFQLGRVPPANRNPAAFLILSLHQTLLLYGHFVLWYFFNEKIPWVRRFDLIIGEYQIHSV